MSGSQISGFLDMLFFLILLWIGLALFGIALFVFSILFFFVWGLKVLASILFVVAIVYAIWFFKKYTK